jgi:pescadillo protein
MMSKKSKRLYGRMQHGIQKKQDAIEQLEAKRKIFENESSKDSTEKSISSRSKKQKKNSK